MWILICFFFLQWFGARTLLTQSIFSPDIIRFCLTFPRGTYVLILIFSLKNYTFSSFLWLLAWGGYPLGKGSKKVPKLGMCQWVQNQVFSCRGKHLDPFQKTWNFRTPPKQPKGSTWTPKGAKACPKGSILEVFLVPFWGPVPTVKTVFPCRREPRLRGSRVPQNSTFFMIFWSWAKRASRESLLEDFLRFGRIFEDFWDPLGLQFRLQVAQVHAQNHCSKKVGFWGARWRQQQTPG